MPEAGRPPGESILIRTAGLQDSGAIARLMTELGYATTPEAMRVRLTELQKEPDHVTIVAASREVVGVAGASLSRYYEKDGLYARLLVLAVASETRGRRIGARLVAAVEEWAAMNEAREVFVNSGTHRADAHRFYERQGYARTGYRFVKPLGDRR